MPLSQAIIQTKIRYPILFRNIEILLQSTKFYCCFFGVISAGQILFSNVFGGIISS